MIGRPLRWTIGDTSPVRLNLGVDLTGASVIVDVHPLGDPTTLITQIPAVISDAASGTVYVTPDASIPAGLYTVDAVVSGAQGIRITQSLHLAIAAHSVLP